VIVQLQVLTRSKLMDWICLPEPMLGKGNKDRGMIESTIEVVADGCAVHENRGNHGRLTDCA
jgi:hypothetical protein